MGQRCGAAGQLRRLVWCVRGFQGGCNYQVGTWWVWGVEVDGSATNKADKGFETATEEEAAGANPYGPKTEKRVTLT
jgi:hypothetical protein